ncbi:MAG: TlpA family protein disulfide reductase [Pirellulaceae bacterium]
MLIHAWRGISSIGWWRQACVMGLVILASGCSKSASDADAAPKPKYEVADDGAPDKAARPSAPAAAPAAPAAPLDMARTEDSQPAPSGMGAPGAAVQQPPSIPGEQLDVITVPQGTPEELMAFIGQLGEKVRALSGQLQGGPGGGGANLAALRQVLEAMLAASDKVLQADVDLETRKRAIEYKAGVLTALSQVAPNPSWTKQILEFAKSLAADTNPAISIEGRVILLGILVGEISQGGSQDVAGLMTQVKSLLADEARNASVLIGTQQAVMALGNLGRENEAREVLALIANAFKDHPDPQLAAEADNMQDQLVSLDLQIDTKLNEVVLKREGADAAFLDAITQLLQRPKTGEIALQRALQYLPILEQSGNYALASKVCELLQTAYKDHPIAEVREHALKRTDIATRRLSLLGKPLSVEGNLPDGSPLDFTKYQGKVVLLAFWSSMSPPCRPELLAVKSVYEKYHAKGFEVIGVCLDQDPAAAARFLDETQLPWVTITNNKLAEQFGVEVIPYLVLTDAQGNVADLFLRGAALEAKLAAVYGEVATTPAAPPAPAAGAPAAVPPAPAANNPPGR